MEQPSAPISGKRIRPRAFAISDQAFSALAVVADFCTILAITIVTTGLYHLLAYGNFAFVDSYVTFALLLAAIYIPLQVARGQYATGTVLADGRNVPAIFTAWNYAFLVLLIVGFLTKRTEDFSRAAIVLTYIAGFGALSLVREGIFVLARHGYARGLLTGRPVMLIGDREALQRFHAAYDPAALGLRVIYETELPTSSAEEAALKRMLKVSVEKARMLQVRDVFILTPWVRHDIVLPALEHFTELPVSVHLGPDGILNACNNARVRHFGAMASLELARPPISPWALMIKRMLDFTGALIGILMLSPLMLFVAAAIRLESPGPVLFRQKRRGFNGRTFHIWKFRTMHVLESDGPVRQAQRNDPRITRVGRILRRLSIDELPQLFNVLKGEMSLVGPRPHAIDHDTIFERRVRRYARRRKVLPGITGWAQVNGYRGETDTREKLIRRIEYDLEYIERWSIWFDIYIIFLTVLSPKTWKNAY